jgi:uncharacterized protein YydD (DUF2326 family)
MQEKNNFLKIEKIKIDLKKYNINFKNLAEKLDMKYYTLKNKFNGYSIFQDELIEKIENIIKQTKQKD